MRRYLQRLLLMAALIVPWVTNAQETFTVGENASQTNDYGPFYGYFMDNYTRSQTLYPSSYLNGLPDGATITKLTFYASMPSSVSWQNYPMTIKLGEVDQTSFATSSFVNTTDFTTVLNGTITINYTTNTCDIEFTEPYISCWML